MQGSKSMNVICHFSLGETRQMLSDVFALLRRCCWRGSEWSEQATCIFSWAIPGKRDSTLMVGSNTNVTCLLQSQTHTFPAPRAEGWLAAGMEQNSTRERTPLPSPWKPGCTTAKIGLLLAFIPLWIQHPDGNLAEFVSKNPPREEMPTTFRTEPCISREMPNQRQPRQSSWNDFMPSLGALKRACLRALKGTCSPVWLAAIAVASNSITHNPKAFRCCDCLVVWFDANGFSAGVICKLEMAMPHSPDQSLGQKATNAPFDVV